MGAAFAIGLINGFTNNIQEEKAKRQADKASLDDLRASMIEAYSDDKVELGDAISNIIEGGEEQIAGRGRVDLFGRPSGDMDLDFTKLRDTVNSVSTYGLTYGSGVNKISLLKDIEWTGTNDQHAMLMSEMNALMQDPTVQNKFRNMSPQERSALVSQMNVTRQTYRSSVQGDKEIDIDVGQNANSLFQGLYWLDQNATNLNAIPEGVTPRSNLTAAQSQDIDSSLNEYAARKPNKAQQGTIVVGVPGIEGNDYDVEDGRFMVLNDIQTANLTVMADKFEVNPQDFFYFWQTKVTNDLGMTAQKSKNLLLASLQIPNEIRNVGMLDPDIFQMRLEQNENALIQTIQKLEKIAGDDVQAMAYVLAPHMTYDKAVPQSETGFGEVRKVKNETIQNYIMRKLYGDKAKDMNFADFETQSQAIINTSDQLALFRQKTIENMAANKGSMGIEGFILDIQGIFGIEGGAISTIAGRITGTIGEALNLKKTEIDSQYDLNVTSEGKLNVYNKENYTEEYDNLLKERIEKARENNVAELEALRITLAFEMARAADPSGRLSNQDIELQYLKLGKPFRTPQDAIPALDIVIAEFEKKRNQVELLKKLGSSTRQASTRDFLVIDGLITADYLSRNKQGMIQRQQGRTDALPAPELTVYDKDSYNFMQSTTATDKNGNAVFQVQPKTGGRGVSKNGAPVYTDKDGNVIPPEDIVYR